MKENDIKSIDCITRAVYETLKGDIPEPVIHDDTSFGEIQQLVSFINRLISEYEFLSEEILRLSNGDIDSPIKCKLAAAHRLKNLQSTLKHLTWQARQVAEGDFSQRMEFLGDFSESFNWMVSQLDINRKELIQNNIELQKLAATDMLTGIGNQTINFTTSIGLASINPEDGSFDTLLNRADIALYKAKNEGRNRVVKHKGRGKK